MDCKGRVETSLEMVMFLRCAARQVRRLCACVVLDLRLTGVRLVRAYRWCNAGDSLVGGLSIGVGMTLMWRVRCSPCVFRFEWCPADRSSRLN